MPWAGWELGKPNIGDLLYKASMARFMANEWRGTAVLFRLESIWVRLESILKHQLVVWSCLFKQSASIICLSIFNHIRIVR